MKRKHDPVIAKEVGARIQRARLEADGMTQQELADFIGVTSRSVAEYESGGIIPYRLLGAISEAVNRPRAWILYGDEGVFSHDQSFEELNAKLDEILKILRRRTK